MTTTATEEYIVSIEFTDGTHISPISYGMPPESTVGTLRIRTGNGTYTEWPLIHIRQIRIMTR